MDERADRVEELAEETAEKAPAWIVPREHVDDRRREGAGNIPRPGHHVAGHGNDVIEEAHVLLRGGTVSRGGEAARLLLRLDLLVEIILHCIGR